MFRAIIAIAFILAGLNHFWHYPFYVRITPPMLPHRLALVYVSGAAEIAGGAGLLIPMLRAAAGWGLIALLIAVFPANVYMAIHPDRFSDLDLPAWVFWLRLPLQLVFIWVVWRILKGRSIDPGSRLLETVRVVSRPMKSFVLILTLLAVTGGQWVMLQSAAWAGMLVNNLRTQSLSCAVSKTFDGKHPCPLCKAIESGKKSEKKSDVEIKITRMEFPPAEVCRHVLALKDSRRAAVPADEFADSVSASPLLRPPRSFPA